MVIWWGYHKQESVCVLLFSENTNKHPINIYLYSPRLVHKNIYTLKRFLGKCLSKITEYPRHILTRKFKSLSKQSVHLFFSSFWKWMNNSSGVWQDNIFLVQLSGSNLSSRPAVDHSLCFLNNVYSNSKARLAPVGLVTSFFSWI